MKSIILALLCAYSLLAQVPRPSPIATGGSVASLQTGPITWTGPQTWQAHNAMGNYVGLASGANDVLRIWEDLSMTAGVYVGMSGYFILTPTSGAPSFIGTQIYIETPTDVVNAGSIHGVVGTIDHYLGGSTNTVQGFGGAANQYGAGTIAHAIGGRFSAAVADGSGDISNAYSTRIYYPSNAGSGVVGVGYAIRINSASDSGEVTNLYAIKIDSAVAEGGAGNRYAIVSDGGQSRLASGAAAVVPLSLIADASQSANLYQNLASDGSTVLSAFDSSARLLNRSVAFSSLGTPANGTQVYCSDCTKATPCASGGSGAFAKRINGAWDCD